VILACAASRTEAGACAVEGVEVLRTGVGPARAAAALTRRLARGPRPSLVVSSGFVGALSADLPLHACITAGAVHRLEEGRAFPLALGPGALRIAQGLPRCALLSASAVTRATAPALPAPSVVDMESAALAEVAAAAGVPFAVLRIVTDTPAAPFPAFVTDLAAALAAGLGRAGLVAAARAAAAAVRSPGVALAFVGSSLAARRALADAWRRGAAGLLG
jgi:phosphorylase superfamily protein